jgi:hypothetical protein
MAAAHDDFTTAPLRGAALDFDIAHELASLKQEPS